MPTLVLMTAADGPGLYRRGTGSRASVFLLSRLTDFAWGLFFVVFRWALLAYIISAAMIGFAVRP